MKLELNAACATLAKTVADTAIEINFAEDGVQINWFGVTQLNCNALTAATAIPLMKRLEALGLKDC